MRKLITILVAVLIVCAVAPLAIAQTSNTATVTITATKRESLSLTASVTGSGNFDLDAALAGQTVPVSITTSWSLLPTRNSVNVCAQMQGALAGTGTNPDTIAVASVYGTGTTGGTGTARTAMSTAVSNCGAFTNGKVVNTYTMSAPGDRKTGATPKSDTLTLSLDAALNVAALEADTYTGHVDILAFAY